MVTVKYISPTAPLLIIKEKLRETRRPDLGLPKGLIIWSNRVPPNDAPELGVNDLNYSNGMLKFLIFIFIYGLL